MSWNEFLRLCIKRNLESSELWPRFFVSILIHRKIIVTGEYRTIQFLVFDSLRSLDEGNVPVECAMIKVRVQYSPNTEYSFEGNNSLGIFKHSWKLMENLSMGKRVLQRLQR
jgi:hypothetical protein